MSFAVFTALLIPQAPAFAMTTAEFIEQVKMIEAQISVIQANIDAMNSNITPEVLGESIDANFYSYINGELMFASMIDNEIAALKQCEVIAFNPTHMWQTVRCEYNGKILYNDIFVAG